MPPLGAALDDWVLGCAGLTDAGGVTTPLPSLAGAGAAKPGCTMPERLMVEAILDMAVI